MTHGHLWDRLAEAKTRLDPVQSKYRVLFEDPATPDEPAKGISAQTLTLDGCCFRG